MILRNLRYSELADKIKKEKHNVIIYGAGMIGQIAVPHFIETFGLYEYIKCYVDMDVRKIGREVMIGTYNYKICDPECLKTPIDNLLLLITNSKFYSVIDFLDSIPVLNAVEGYIIPMIQIHELDYSEPVTIEKLCDTQLIPKKIHYCWFGRGSMPEFLLSCMDTWKKYCPDYEIIEWNEDNYDINRIPYAKEAYDKKRYGFVTDVARLDILYEHGGIYMDTDVRLLRNLDELLYQPAFVGVEKWGNINTGGLVGAMPGHDMIKEMLDYRKGFHFILEDGSLNIETNGLYETLPFIKHGMKVDNTMQVVNDMTIYPSSVFHPYDYLSCEDKIEEWTYAKHCFYGGWMDKSDLKNRGNTQEKYQQILKRAVVCGNAR